MRSLQCLFFHINRLCTATARPDSTKSNHMWFTMTDPQNTNDCNSISLQNAGGLAQSGRAECEKRTRGRAKLGSHHTTQSEVSRPRLGFPPPAPRAAGLRGERGAGGRHR